MSHADVSEVTQLLDGIGLLYPDGESWLWRRLQDVVNGDALCKVVRTDGQLSGVAILTPKSDGTIKLSTLFVAEQYRGRGVGSTLMDDVLSELDRGSRREVYVTVAHHLSLPLSRLLLPRGFTQVATEFNRYGLGRHEVVYTRVAT